MEGSLHSSQIACRGHLHLPVARHALFLGKESMNIGYGDNVMSTGKILVGLRGRVHSMDKA